MTKLRCASMMRLEDALKSLPNIKPRKARQLLKDIDAELMEQSLNDPEGKQTSYFTEEAGVRISSDDIAEIFIKDDWDVPRVSPDGALVLIKLYSAGAFEMKKSREGLSHPEALQMYANSKEALLAKQEMHEKEEAEREHRFNEMINNPDTLNQDQFSIEVLDRIFWRHKGAGSHTMKIGGIDVSKFVRSDLSNSGKSKDHEIRFSWKDKDGKQHELIKPSMFSSNRRNDEDRNWGLPK